MIDFYKQFIGSDDLVFDIGANIGETAEVFAQLGRKVIAVEPVPESFAVMQEAFREQPKITIVQAAAGLHEGQAFISTSQQAPTIGTASMSPRWIESVLASKRFGNEDHWNHVFGISVITLDKLISDYGLPAFIKIDVEGYELEVLQGLSQPVKTLSFEFTPERFEAAVDCLIRCTVLGMDSFTFSLMQTFHVGEWTGFDGIVKRLEDYRDSTTAYGDVYARM